MTYHYNRKNEKAKRKELRNNTTSAEKELWRTPTPLFLPLVRGDEKGLSKDDHPPSPLLTKEGLGEVLWQFIKTLNSFSGVLIRQRMAAEVMTKGLIS